MYDRGQAYTRHDYPTSVVYVLWGFDNSITVVVSYSVLSLPDAPCAAFFMPPSLTSLATSHLPRAHRVGF